MTAKQDSATLRSSLRPVHQRKVSTVVAEQLMGLIRQGVLPVGGRLPSEKTLAERMGVSRPSVREALAALEAVGVVDARPGRGSFVHRLPSEDGGKEPLVLLETEECCREIIEARDALEPPTAALAARMRSPQDLSVLRSIHTQMQKLAREQDFDHYITQDKAYHRALVQATHNSLLEQILIPLVETMDQRIYREFTRNHYVRTPQAWSRIVDVHDKILTAVSRGDGTGAARAMRTHWARMKRAYEA